MRIANLPIILALVLTISCSSGGKPEPSVLFDETPLSDNSSTPKLSTLFRETPLSDNSSKMTIKIDVSQGSVAEGSMEMMCECARLAVARGFKYFYIDKRETFEDGWHSFRVTFYKSPPEGIPVMNPMDEDGSGEGADPMNSAMDAEAFAEVCNEIQRMR